LPNTFEVGIVGAGVAGSSCAQVLGEAGVKVALFDHSYPREKPCGGLIDSIVVEEFNVPEELLENEVRWILVERFKFRVKLFFEPSLFLVSRKDFDYYLLQRALKNKSMVFFDEKVSQAIRGEKGWILKTNRDRRVKVKVLIGADGCPSLIRKCAFRPIPPQFLAITAGYNFPCSSNYIEKAFPKNTVEAYYSHKYVQKGGFIWIFPKRASINVGIGSIGTGKKLKQSLSEFIFSHPAGERLRHLKGHFFSHLIPIIWMEDFFDLPCSGGDWALIGDAAGHVNPINGMGIYYAMKGGMLCGLAFLDGDLNRFEKYWRKEYGNELYHGAKNFSKFYGNLGFFSWLRYLFENFLSR
jgi:geranylgeranyl reductase family protein